jgi:Protein of unknown function (DUF3302)
MFLDYFALVVLIFVAVVLFYGIIAIHDIPYEIAKRRNHPQQDAIHVAGWISLFTLHAIWPFLLGQVDAHARPGPDQQGPIGPNSRIDQPLHCKPFDEEIEIALRSRLPSAKAATERYPRNAVIPHRHGDGFRKTILDGAPPSSSLRRLLPCPGANLRHRIEAGLSPRL